MRIEVLHHTDKPAARRKIEEKIESMQQQYGHLASDIEKTWNSDTLTFSCKARGLTVKGTLEITDTTLILDGKLPLMARPFEPRIHATVEQAAKEMFPGNQ
ncbi:MAG TPA: polyhydroxyalkanoic acid system family protein [Thermoanaerobaculia bacterium]|nr:polyhydroxyalkanoic acid system family protein [Thermoanaerobaculia bacterium]